MGFNGIGGFLSAPGMIPWYIMVLYFVGAAVFAVFYGLNHGGASRFKTVDFVYIGVGAAFTVVWEFFVGPFLNKFVPGGAVPFIDFGFFGRVLILLIVAGVVRKVGVGMFSMFIFNILGDIFHYGFSGEPMYTIYETLTYGLLIDVVIAFTRGHLFGIGIEQENGRLAQLQQNYRALVPAVTGAIIAFLWTIPDNVIYAGFFSPFLYGGIVNWQKIAFNFGAALPGNIVFGVIAAFIAIRVTRVLGQ
ncbi:hypothetical protein IX51_02715 [uncultured archaeon]|nr:hypothetical protein IX51_02715 [uncultured archaeon]